MMIHFAIVIGYLVFRFSTGYRNKKKGKHVDKFNLIAVGLVVSFVYLGSIKIVGDMYIKNTEEVTSTVTRVELAPVSTTPQPYSTSATYAQITASTNSDPFYLVHVADRNIEKIPVESTVISIRSANPRMYARVTVPNSNWFTDWFILSSSKTPTVKYTLFLPEGAVDLATKPDPAPYPEYLK